MAVSAERRPADEERNPAAARRSEAFHFRPGIPASCADSTSRVPQPGADVFLGRRVRCVHVQAEDVASLDPYQLMAVLGKRIIHPGGKRSTEELFRLARIETSDRVLEIGCGVGTTAIEIARRFGAMVSAVDVDVRMVAAASANVARAGVAGQVEVHAADIQELPFADESFDRVVIEAVTMFVDRERAASEVVRVCRRGGRVVDHEFIWRKKPPVAAREIFVGEVCPGIQFDTAEDWRSLYERAGLGEIEILTGPFAMMTPAGFVRDEGRNTIRVMIRAVSRVAYLRKLGWLMRRMIRSMPYLGYVVIAGVRPARPV